MHSGSLEGVIDNVRQESFCPMDRAGEKLETSEGHAI